MLASGIIRDAPPLGVMMIAGSRSLLKMLGPVTAGVWMPASQATSGTGSGTWTAILISTK
jgi:hypothetical protein